jgi:hypothetical protein
MTPIELETLLKCYYSPEYIPSTRVSESELTTLINDGLVVECNNTYYTTTDRGSLHVKQVCNLPYPTKKSVWIDGGGEVIKESYE